jgi:hypothetical protein
MINLSAVSSLPVMDPIVTSQREWLARLQTIIMGNDKPSETADKCQNIVLTKLCSHIYPCQLYKKIIIIFSYIYRYYYLRI